MGRGSSKAGNNSTTAAKQQIRLNEAINNALDGNLNVSLADVRTIQNNSYTIDTGALSSNDRSLLSSIIYYDALSAGPVARNSMTTVQNINDGKRTAINIGNLDSSDLIEFARIANNSGRGLTSSAVQDALKLLSFYNQ